MGAHRLPYGIDADSFHLRHVNHQAVVADGLACDAMSAPTNRNQKVVFASLAHTLNDIGRACATSDHRRTPVNHRVRDGSRLIVSGLARAKGLPAE
ncbi:MAG: hypothetical protein ABSC65_28820 [Acidobacteriaceae bacterium]